MSGSGFCAHAKVQGTSTAQTKSIDLRIGVLMLELTFLRFNRPAMTRVVADSRSFDFTSCYSGTSTLVALGKDHYAFIYEQTGTNTSNPPGGYLDKTSFRCVGINSSFAGKHAGTSTCEGIDKDGDKRLTYFSMDRDGTVVKEFVLGTGKYEGAIEKGSTSAMGPLRPVRAGRRLIVKGTPATFRM